MTTKDYTYLLNKPYSLHERQAAELESILKEFPYLQSARAIYLKGLYNKDSFRYNTELKKAAAYTADRSVLFDFITSKSFRSIDRDVLEGNEKAISEIIVAVEHAGEEPAPALSPVEKLEQSIKNLIKESENTELGTTETLPLQEVAATTKPEAGPKTETVAEESVAGRPLDFNPQETHSFAEWLQLSRLKPHRPFY